jgi:glycosyltransferase involved in cell wall biosynthesis
MIKSPDFHGSQLRALVSTIEPIDGGVPSMTRWICSTLEEMNIQPVLAWYAPWRNHPELSVPFYKLFRATPKSICGVAFDNYESYGIGAWFPELEFSHYLPSKRWKKLLKSCQLHLAVSGNPLCATPYILEKTPFLAWVATPWEADRKNRVQNFSPARKALDSFLNKPVLSRLEKRILCDKDGSILSLSKYSSMEFERLSGVKMENIMIMPVNTEVFFPKTEKTIPWRIGFSGRYCDPRKNITLLLNATRILVDMGYNVELFLIGDRNFEQLMPLIQDLGVQDSVRCFGHMSSQELASILQSIDVFVIPSYQEGLCIAALEAMACGVPVISTRCGGPEDYVIPEKTGAIVDSSPVALAIAILDMCRDRALRDRLSKASSEWILANASEAASKEIFYEHLSNLAYRSRSIGTHDKVFYDSSA